VRVCEKQGIGVSDYRRKAVPVKVVKANFTEMKGIKGINARNIQQKIGDSKSCEWLPGNLKLQTANFKPCFPIPFIPFIPVKIKPVFAFCPTWTKPGSLHPSFLAKRSKDQESSGICLPLKMVIFKIMGWEPSLNINAGGGRSSVFTGA